MSNLISFVNAFLSYLLVFAAFVTAMIVAGKIGTAIRKNKNEKEAAAALVQAEEN